MRPFCVYILRCSDGSYYTGHTAELEARVAQHQDGLVPGYTAMRRPVELVYAGETTSRAEAIMFERQIKRWSRAKKEALVRGDWATLKRLARRLPKATRARARNAVQESR